MSGILSKRRGARLQNDEEDTMRHRALEDLLPYADGDIAQRPPDSPDSTIMPSSSHDEVRPPTTLPPSSSSTPRFREVSSRAQLNPARPAPTTTTSARIMPIPPLREPDLAHGPLYSLSGPT